MLLTGATGYIGSATLTALTAKGHDVVAAVRDQRKADAIGEAGGTGVVLDFADRARLVELMRASDAVIHTAADGDDPEGFDRGVAEAAIEALGGTDTPYVHTGGVWIYGSGDAITEADPMDPPALTAWRAGVIALLESADLPVTVVHPGIVYGHGKGIATMVGGGPKDDQGRTVLIGDGTQHWTTIHVDDLADLYAAVVESGGGFADVLGVGGDNPTVQQIAAVTAGEAGTVAEDPSATRERFGADFAEALLLDQQATGEKARAIGGWTPSRPSLLDELRGS